MFLEDDLHENVLGVKNVSKKRVNERFDIAFDKSTAQMLPNYLMEIESIVLRTITKNLGVTGK